MSQHATKAQIMRNATYERTLIEEKAIPMAIKQNREFTGNCGHGIYFN
jgi:hypothetical protein